MSQLIGEWLGPFGTVFVIAAVILISGVKIIREYQRAVVFRLGRMVAPRGPGIRHAGEDEPGLQRCQGRQHAAHVLAAHGAEDDGRATQPQVGQRSGQRSAARRIVGVVQ